jgi:U4/U6 small nuclear ribonucleoprotein PRP3
VYVEGSAKAVKFFKRVMLVRVDWTETARPLPGEEALLPPAKVEFEQEENMAENRCDLMWEGPIKEKTFNRFMPKNTESERAVRDFLGEKNQGYWDVRTPRCLQRLPHVDPY